MLTKLALAGALAIPLGVFSLSGSAMAEDAWNPHDSYNPSVAGSVPKPLPLRSRTEQVRPAAMSLSCAAARQIVREDGYHNVKTDSCGARSYVFGATRRGHSVVLHVDPRNGNVSQG